MAEASTATPGGPLAQGPGPDPAAGAPTVTVGAGPFSTSQARRRYWGLVAGLSVLAALFAAGILAWDNPMPFGTTGFWRIAELRATTLTAITVVVICQGVATVAFQSAVSNRIITPSIMGFEALYVAVQTSAVYLMGVAGVVALTGVPQFALQVVLMVAFSLVLFGWLLSGRYGNIQVMLLVGIIIGGGLRSVSTFMQRLLTPSEFDVLTARLFGSISNAETEYIPYAIVFCVLAGGGLWWNARTLNTVALGKDICLNLGVRHGRQTILTLVMVSVLMATSTALIGPMTFFGFLVATLTYQIAGTHDHRRLFPLGVLVGFVVLAGASFIMDHVFYAQGVVSIIIELVGGTVFLVVILRKGRL